MNSIVVRLFASGWLGSAVFNSLLQDMTGKQEYIRRAQEGWVSGSITVPLALFIGLIAAWMYVSAVRAFNKEE